MTNAIRNRHHNVPRSYGGSNDHANVVSINADLHTDFHRRFGHLTPDQLMRLLVVCSAYDGPPKSFLTDFLNTTLQPDWRTMYSSHALTPVQLDPSVSNGTPSDTYRLASEYVETAQETLTDLNALLRGASTGRVQTMDEHMRTQVTMGVSRLGSIVHNYGQMLGSSYTAPATEGTSDIRVSIHTTYQLLSEASATMSSVQALLGQGLGAEARNFRRSALQFFRVNSGTEAVHKSLTQTNGKGHLLYTNPLDSHYRTLLLDQVHGVTHEKPCDIRRKELVAVLNAHTRKLLGNILREHEVIDRHCDA